MIRMIHTKKQEKYSNKRVIHSPMRLLKQNIITLTLKIQRIWPMNQNYIKRDYTGVLICH